MSQDMLHRRGMLAALGAAAGLAANLNPSSRIVPAGVIAMTRAQEYGYSVLHVG